jgi:hypothetical protein
MYLNKRLPDLMDPSQDNISEATTAGFISVNNTFGKSKSGKKVVEDLFQFEF